MKAYMQLHNHANTLANLTFVNWRENRRTIVLETIEHHNIEGTGATWYTAIKEYIEYRTISDCKLEAKKQRQNDT